jgi:hypothetical protein
MVKLKVWKGTLQLGVKEEVSNKSKDSKDSFKKTRRETTYQFDHWGYYKFSTKRKIIMKVQWKGISNIWIPIPKSNMSMELTSCRF